MLGWQQQWQYAVSGMFALLPLQKTSAGDKSLYAVTDDEATVAILLKRMREMDPAGNGIVRSEFKRYVLRTMHTGNMRQNHRLWRRLQTKMVKQGVLEIGVTEVIYCPLSLFTTLCWVATALAGIYWRDIFAALCCMGIANFAERHAGY